MKMLIVFSLLILGSCAGNSEKDKEDSHAQVQTIDSVQTNVDTAKESVKDSPYAEKSSHYSNDRFRNVTVTKIAENEFRIIGKARVFEASFSWVIEDGHQEIDSGYNTTDAGAPEWGNFMFTLKVKKKEPITVLHLILFEASAKDGSRQSELPILLDN